MAFGNSEENVAQSISRTTIREFLAEQIKREVKRRHATHAEVAKEVGIARTVITAVLNGRLAKISTERLLKITDGLGIKFEIRVSHDK